MADPNEKPLPTVVSADDDSMRVAVLGHLLRSAREKTASTLETLATLLEAAVPDYVTVERGGYFWSKVRPVVSLSVSFDNASFEIKKSKHGAPVVLQGHVVRGITIKTTEVSMEDCLTAIVGRLTELEHKSAATRIALKDFVQGR